MCTVTFHHIYHVFSISLIYIYFDSSVTPEFATLLPKVQKLAAGSVFTLNCTPSAANPPPSRYVFERDGVDITEGVSGSILSVTFLKRDDTGNYTYTAMGIVRSVTIATYLLVTGKNHFHFPPYILCIL